MNGQEKPSIQCRSFSPCNWLSDFHFIFLFYYDNIDHSVVSLFWVKKLKYEWTWSKRISMNIFVCYSCFLWVKISQTRHGSTKYMISFSITHDTLVMTDCMDLIFTASPEVWQMSDTWSWLWWTYVVWPFDLRSKGYIYRQYSAKRLNFTNEIAV